MSNIMDSVALGFVVSYVLLSHLNQSSPVNSIFVVLVVLLLPAKFLQLSLHTLLSLECFVSIILQEQVIVIEWVLGMDPVGGVVN